MPTAIPIPSAASWTSTVAAPTAAAPIAGPITAASPPATISPTAVGALAATSAAFFGNRAFRLAADLARTTVDGEDVRRRHHAANVVDDPVHDVPDPQFGRRIESPHARHTIPGIKDEDAGRRREHETVLLVSTLTRFELLRRRDLIAWQDHLGFHSAFSTPSVRTKNGPRYLALRHLDTIEEDLVRPNTLPMERKQMRNRKPIFESVGDAASRRLDPPLHERLGRRIQKRVHHFPQLHRGIDERTVRVAGLSAERGIHQHRVAGFVHAAYVGDLPLDFDLRAFGVAPGDFDGFGIRVNAQNAGRPRQFRGNREDAVPAAQVYDGATCDVAPTESKLDHLRRDRGGRRILFRRWRRNLHRLQRLQDSPQLHLLRRPVPLFVESLLPCGGLLHRFRAARGDRHGKIGRAVPENRHQALPLEAVELRLELVDLHAAQDLEELLFLQPDRTAFVQKDKGLLTQAALRRSRVLLTKRPSDHFDGEGIERVLDELARQS